MTAYRKLYQMYWTGKLPVAVAEGWKHAHNRKQSPLEEFARIRNAAKWLVLWAMLVLSTGILHKTAMMVGPENFGLLVVKLVGAASCAMLYLTGMLVAIWILSEVQKENVRSFVNGLEELEDELERSTDEMALMGAEELTKLAIRTLIEAAVAVIQKEAIGSRSDTHRVRERFSQKFNVFKKFGLIPPTDNWDEYFEAARTLEAVS